VVIKVRKEMQHPWTSLFPLEIAVIQVKEDWKALKVLKDWKEKRALVVWKDIQGTEVNPENV
jgi:hypothetical protein